MYREIYAYPLGFHQIIPFMIDEWDSSLHLADLGQQGYRGYPRLRQTFNQPCEVSAASSLCSSEPS